MANNTASRLLAGCTALSEDIQYCQQRGKKVLLSIGGTWGPDPAHNYDVTSVANGKYFADFLWKAFGPFDPSWTGPRPFDLISGQHTVLDGFDFDIQVQLPDQSGYIALLRELRAYIDAHNEAAGSDPIVITGSPHCPLLDGWPHMKELITAVSFDKLWIQFYGNNLCEAGGTGFNYEAWEAFVATTTSYNALLYVGLPASTEAIGYVTPAGANTIVDSLKDRPSFGGVMVWDVAIAKDYAIDNVPIYEEIRSHMADPSSVVASAATSLSATRTAVMATVHNTRTHLTTSSSETGIYFITTPPNSTAQVLPAASSPPEAANSTDADMKPSGHTNRTISTVLVTASATCSSGVARSTVSIVPIGDGPAGSRTKPTSVVASMVASAVRGFTPDPVFLFISALLVAMAVVIA